MSYVETYREEPGTEFALKCPIQKNDHSSTEGTGVWYLLGDKGGLELGGSEGAWN
jgi:hypothetical protein